MSDEQMLELVGRFYAGVYDGLVRMFRRLTVLEKDLDLDIYDPKIDELFREFAHYALVTVAGEFEAVSDEDNQVRFAIDDNGELIDDLDDRLDPIVGWLSGLDGGLVFKYTKWAAPRKMFEMLGILPEKYQGM